jgi:hypothetical protein
MDLFNIKEHVDTSTPITYELKIKLNSERMKASVPQHMHMHFYDHLNKALASNIYEFKKNNYPNDDIYLSENLGMLITYNKDLQQKYLQIIQVLNACSDEIVEKVKKSYSSDGIKMQEFANAYMAEHFLTYEEKQEKHIKEGRSKLKLFALYEDRMQDVHEIRVKLNDRDIIRDSSTLIYTKIDDFFNNALATYLYDFKKTNLPDKKINFYRNSGTLSTYDNETHEVFLNALQNLNNQSDDIVDKLKQMNQSTLQSDGVENFLKTYLAHFSLKNELSNQQSSSIEITKKKLKV